MEKDLEYTKMACYYDKLYKNKDYKKEVEFIKAVVGVDNLTILDAGCGTGNHSKILAGNGYNVSGFDLSPEMVEIAKQKVNDNFQVGNLLTYSIDKKFDLIISFYAIFNHLKSYKEFNIALQNLLKMLDKNGTIIIDLHNPQKNGKKIDEIENIKRIMDWKVNPILKTETTKLTYVVDGVEYKTKHKFKIFEIEKINDICGINNLECNFYENYNINSVANNKSKNIQVVIKKR